MSTDITVSKARVDDAPSIATVQHDTWLTTYPNEELGITRAAIEERVRGFETSERIDKWRGFITDPTQHITVAKAGSKIVGFSAAKKSTPASLITALYVLPAYHGTGTAQKLMDASLAWLGDKQAISLEVASYNDRAVNFYRKYDFRPTGETGNSGDIPVIFMSRSAKSATA